jgi:valyl-tRNA synthetase
MALTRCASRSLRWRRWGDLGRVEGYRNFCNKLWNAARYVLMNTEEHAEDLAGPVELSVADRWIRGRLERAIGSLRENLAVYRFDLAAQVAYEFVWYEFCDWYLELSKPVLQGADVEAAAKRGTRRTLLEVLEAALRLLHPFMPFITEEVWQRVGRLAGRTGPSIMLEPFPAVGDFTVDDEAERQVTALQAIVLGIRQIRGELDVPPSRATPVFVRSERPGDAEAIAALSAVICRVASLESVTVVDSEAELPPCATALVEGRTVLAPFSRLVDDFGAEIARLEKRLARAEQDRGKSVAKLGNESFVANAPQEVVEKERGRVEELDRQIAQLAEQMRRLDAARSASPAEDGSS